MRLKILYTALLALGIALFGACSSEKQAGQPDSPEVDVTILAGGNMRGATDNGTPQERKIVRIRVLVFYRDTKLLDRQAYDENPLGFASVPINLNMTIHAGNKIFCVIANEPASMKPTLDAVTKLSDLDNLTIADENTYNVPNTPLPMTTYKDEFVVAGRVTPVELSVRRALGKISAKIVKDPSNNYTVTLNSVQVIRTPVRSTLMAGHPVDPTVAGALTSLPAQTVFAPSSNVTVSTPIEITPKYVYEHYRGTGATAEVNATALRINITMNGTTKDYDVPLISGFSGADKIYEIKRNAIADLEATVHKEGITIKYTVLPWVTVPEFDKVAGEEDSNLSIKDWVSPNEYPHDLVP